MSSVGFSSRSTRSSFVRRPFAWRELTPGDVAADVLLLLLDELLLLVERARRGEDALGLLAPVGRVAAGVRRQAPVLQVDDLLGDAVEEAPVVRHDEVRAPRAREVVLEELDGLEVEVVRGLVEEEHVGRREDRARQHRAVLLPARELRERPLEVRLVEPEARQRLLDLRDHVVAALVLEPVRQRVVAVVDGGGVVAVGHRVLEPAHLRLDRVERLEGAGREVVERLGGVRLERLVDGGDPHRVGPDDLAGVRLLAAEGDAQEGRLAGAVAADEPDLLPGVVLPGDFPQHLLGAVALRDAVESVEHGAILRVRRAIVRGPRVRTSPSARRSVSPSTRLLAEKPADERPDDDLDPDGRHERLRHGGPQRIAQRDRHAETRQDDPAEADRRERHVAARDRGAQEGGGQDDGRDDPREHREHREERRGARRSVPRRRRRCSS